MKIAVAVASEEASPKAFVVFRGVKESMIKAARMGYDGVELALKTPDEINPEEVKEVLKENNLGCPLISTGRVFAELGLYFTHPSLEKREELIHMYESFIDTAKFLGSMVNIGRVRGFIPEGQTHKTVKGVFLETLGPIEEHARKSKVTLLLEPINRYETNFINTLEEAGELLKEVDSPYLKMMPDLFHMNIEEPSIEKSLKKHKDTIAYVHFADSNRCAPGIGHLNFRSIVKTLEKIGYSGWVAIEILPIPDPDTAALKAIKYLRRIIPEKMRDNDASG